MATRSRTAPKPLPRLPEIRPRSRRQVRAARSLASAHSFCPYTDIQAPRRAGRLGQHSTRRPTAPRRSRAIRAGVFRRRAPWTTSTSCRILAACGISPMQKLLPATRRDDFLASRSAGRNGVAAPPFSPLRPRLAFQHPLGSTVILHPVRAGEMARIARLCANATAVDPKPVPDFIALARPPLQDPSPARPGRPKKRREPPPPLHRARSRSSPRAKSPPSTEQAAAAKKPLDSSTMIWTSMGGGTAPLPLPTRPDPTWARARRPWPEMGTEPPADRLNRSSVGTIRVNLSKLARVDPVLLLVISSSAESRFALRRMAAGRLGSSPRPEVAALRLFQAPLVGVRRRRPSHQDGGLKALSRRPQIAPGSIAVRPVQWAASTLKALRLRQGSEAGRRQHPNSSQPHVLTVWDVAGLKDGQQPAPVVR